MDDVEIHFSRRRPAENRVEVRAVVVQETARVVDDLRDVQDVLFENSESVGIRQHEGERLRTRGRLERLEVDASVLRGNLDQIEPEHYRLRGIRAVCGVGDDYLMPFLPALPAVRLCDEEARVLPLCPRLGLYRACVHSRHASE